MASLVHSMRGTTSKEPQLLSIGGLAEATGVPSETIRIWERRYGQPQPIRLPSGHRRYDESHVRWLRRMAEGVAQGLRPGRLVAMTDAEIDRLIDPIPEATKEDPELATLMGLLREYRGTEFNSAMLASWRRMGPTLFLTQRIAPLVHKVGRAWADGSLPVRAEHFLSQKLEDLLRSLRLSLNPDERNPKLVLATLSGEEHDLGLQMAALATAAHRVPTLLLGTNLPEAELVAAVTEIRPKALCISVSLATGGLATDKRLRELRQKLPPSVSLVVGGMGTRNIRRKAPGIEYLDGIEALERWLQHLDKS